MILNDRIPPKTVKSDKICQIKIKQNIKKLQKINLMKVGNIDKQKVYN